MVKRDWKDTMVSKAKKRRKSGSGGTSIADSDPPVHAKRRETAKPQKHRSRGSKKSFSRGVKLKELLLCLTVVVLCVVAYWNIALAEEFVYIDRLAVRNNNDVNGKNEIASILTNDFLGNPLRNPTSVKTFRPISSFLLREIYNLANSAFPEASGEREHVLVFKTGQLILHALCSISVALVSRHFFESDGVPFGRWVAVILFAVHPIHTEVVNSVVGAAEMLCFLFMIASFEMYLLARKAHTNADSFWGNVCLCLTLVFAAVASFCKEIGLSMFGIVMLLDFVLHRLSKSNTSISTVRPMRRFMSPSPSGINAISQHRNQFFLREAIIACVGLITVCGRLKYGGTPGHDTYINPLPKMKMIPRLTTALLYNAYHFFLVFYPKTLCVDYMSYPFLAKLSPSFSVLFQMAHPDMARMWLVTIYIVTITVLASKAIAFLVKGRDSESNTTGQSRNHYETSFSETGFILALVWMILPFIPSMNILVNVGFLVAERVMYTPSFGVFLLIGMMVEWARSRLWNKDLASSTIFRACFRALWFTLLFFLVILCVSRCHRRNLEWRNEHVLFESVLEVNPNNSRAHYNYGKQLERNQLFQEAVDAYERAVEVNPLSTRSLENMGAIYVRQLKQPLKAIEVLKQHVKVGKPKFGSLNNLGFAYEMIGNATDAESYYRQALALVPSSWKAHYNIGNALFKQKRFCEASMHYNSAWQMVSDEKWKEKLRSKRDNADKKGSCFMSPVI